MGELRLSRVSVGTSLCRGKVYATCVRQGDAWEAEEQVRQAAGELSSVEGFRK